MNSLHPSFIHRPPLPPEMHFTVNGDHIRPVTQSGGMLMLLDGVQTTVWQQLLVTDLHMPASKFRRPSSSTRDVQTPIECGHPILSGPGLCALFHQSRDTYYEAGRCRSDADLHQYMLALRLFHWPGFEDNQLDRHESWLRPSPRQSLR